MTATPSTPCSQVPHKYGTRKQQNSVIRPSARLRECDSPSPLTLLSTPRRIKPLTSLANHSHNLPFLQLRSTSDEPEKSPIIKEQTQDFVDMSGIEFPPRNVVLHPDDANNKTFLAIGRAFMSVNNRAMTVKDMAELSMKHGLVCQNVSAAGQAITSFIRNHLQRCDVEQDFPLLLRHVLSGTARDDNLAAALYSRTGGNTGREKGKDSRDRNSVQDENQSKVERLTSFRRGTTVWYLSKVAGAVCPFARCGIALRDYVDIAPDCSSDRSLHSASSLFSPSLKRKRQRDGLRSCHVESGSVAGQDEVAEQPRPPKVRLTLKLKPSSASPVTDSDLSDRDDDLIPDGSSSPNKSAQDCLPPYPIQRRISIPLYTPCEDAQTAFFDFPPQPRMFTHPYPQHFAATSPVSHRRSPSVPHSIASPPPDSEGDDDLFNPRSHSRIKHDSDFDLDWDSSDDADDMWTPERETEDTVSIQQIKQEDSSGALDSLLFDQGSSTRILHQKIKIEQIEPSVSFAGDVPVSAVKSELDDDLWPSSSINDDPDRDLSLPLEVQIKEENMSTPAVITETDQEDDAVVVSSGSPSPDDLPSTSSRDMKWAWRDVELLGPDSVDVEEFTSDWDEPMYEPSSPATLHFYPDVCGSDRTSSSEDLVPAYTPPLTPSSPVCSTSTRTWSSPEAEPFSPVTSFAQMSLHTTSHRGYNNPFTSNMELDEEVGRPCKPCGPLSILVTRIEGVLVYQIPAAQCLRRVLDNSVYLPAISQFLESAPADGLQFMRMNSTVNMMRSHDWVSLSAAQAFVASHRSDRSRLLEVFLSDDLADFFHLDLRKITSTASKPSSTAFSTTLLTHKDTTPKQQVAGTLSPVIVDAGPNVNRLPWEQGMLTQNLVDKHLHIIDSRAALALPSIAMGSYARPIKGDTVTSPLSPQEQDLFQSLCQDPDLIGETADPGTARQAKFSQESITPSDSRAITVNASDNENSTHDTSMVPEKNVMDTEVSQPKLKTLDTVSDGEHHGSSPLRRSKRAATAVANQRITTRPRRRTTKH